MESGLLGGRECGAADSKEERDWGEGAHGEEGPGILRSRTASRTQPFCLHWPQLVQGQLLRGNLRAQQILGVLAECSAQRSLTWRPPLTSVFCVFFPKRIFFLSAFFISLFYLLC